MSSAGAASRAAVSAPATRTRAVATSDARAEASRRNGAKSRGPKTAEGKARSAQNALRHGLRAAKHVVLPQEDAAAFAAHEAALLAELAPVGALQTVLARRVAVAAWRLERADRLETEVLEFRRYEGASAGVAVMRDGNGPRSLETLLRYRNAAATELMRALRMLKALQAEQAAGATAGPARRRAAPAPRGIEPNELKRHETPRLDYVMPAPPLPGPTLHEGAASWLPHRHETAPATRRAPSVPGCRTNPKPPGTGAQ